MTPPLTAAITQNSDTEPDVSVIVAVYNAMPYLTECLDSILCQSIGRDRIEIIAVNDGSTDDGGRLLDRHAAQHPQLRVIHQENSGGPSSPRNRALAYARGRFVLVVDADDFLGEEALERLVAMADRQHSDVVLAKPVGLGRSISDKAHRHAPVADLYRTEVYRSLHSAKLMRRSMLERENIRYPEDLWFGEDQIFVTAAYLAARRISVVGDYDCYFLRWRDDGGNITARRKNADATVAHIERVMAMVDQRVTDPVGRRRMLGRHFRALIDKAIVPAVRVQDEDPTYAHEVLVRSHALCDVYFDNDIDGELSQLARIRLWAFRNNCAFALSTLARYDPRRRHPELLVDQGRVYRKYPLFRDPRAGLPDDLYDVTDTLRVPHRLDAITWYGRTRLRFEGYAYIEALETRHMATELVLRNRHTDEELRSPVAARTTHELSGTGKDHSMAGFLAEIDLGTVRRGMPLPVGTWDVFLDVRAEGVSRTVRFGRFQKETLETTGRRPQVIQAAHNGGWEVAVSVFFTRGWNNLSLEAMVRRPMAEALCASAA